MTLLGKGVPPRGPLKSFTAEEQRTQRFAENTAVFLCGPLRPSFLCGEVLNDFKGPQAEHRTNCEHWARESLR
jgi:hypothetical protein